MSSLGGKLVLITGASAGIGKQASLAFAARKAKVIALARNADKLRELSDEAGEPSGIITFGADVADAESMQRVTGRILEELGVPDVIVANAGRGMDAQFVNTGDDELRSLFELNVLGVYRTIRPFIPGMVERGSGRVLLISSIVGKRGIPNYSAYSASKFALHGVADALRAELCGSGVSVGVLCPASTETRFHENALRSGPAQRRVRPRRHSAESVARAIVSMAGSKRTEMILGLEAKLMVLADVIAPTWVDRLLARILRK